MVVGDTFFLPNFSGPSGPKDPLELKDTHTHTNINKDHI